MYHGTTGSVGELAGAGSVPVEAVGTGVVIVGVWVTVGVGVRGP